MNFKVVFSAFLTAASFTVCALPAPTNTPGTVFTPASEAKESALSVKVTMLDMAKWSSQALDLYRKSNKPGYIGWYDLKSESYSGSYTSNYPQDTLMGAADVARQAVINNNPAYVSGIVTILDPSGGVRCKIIFIGANGQPDGTTASEFVSLVQSSSNAAPEQ